MTIAIDELALWGGVECTVNRVGDTPFSTSRWRRRIRIRVTDLDRLLAAWHHCCAIPGALWERVAPIEAVDSCDWTMDRRAAHGTASSQHLRDRRPRPSWQRARLHRAAQRLTLRPAFARHAAATARRYPWIADWTPVNEPCTTARFSCLYGHWYPHLPAMSAASGWRCSIRSTRRDWRCGRYGRSTPNARFIQTDDLGKTYSQPGWCVTKPPSITPVGG
jgi:dTDP-4-dehydrorhamnose reductase